MKTRVFFIYNYMLLFAFLVPMTMGMSGNDGNENSFFWLSRSHVPVAVPVLFPSIPAEFRALTGLRNTVYVGDFTRAHEPQEGGLHFEELRATHAASLEQL